MGASGVREDHQEAGTPPAMAVPPVLVKGKRSKRQRVHAPPVVLSASASASAAPEWSSSAASAESTADATVLAIPVRVPVAPKQEQQDAAAAIVVVATSSVHSKHPRVHECSICGAEFGSGQALGGHMRRHRPLMPAAARDDAPRKEKSLLELDLNMPAPCDEVAAEARAVTSPRFAFDVAERPAAAAPLLFPASAASALVDCHY